MLWNEKLKKYFLTSGLKRTDILLLLVLFILIGFCYTFQMPVQEAFQSHTDISLGYNAKQGDDGLYYVLDEGHERLQCFDEKGKIKFVIENPSDEVSDILYIDDFAMAEDGIYLSATEWDEMAIARECVLFFDKKGHYVNTLYEKDYSQNRTNKHCFYGIRQKDGVPQFVEAYVNCVRIGDWNIPYPNAFNAVSDAVFVDDTVYILDKDGTIRAFQKGSKTGTSIYSLEKEETENVVPYRLTADSEGRIYFTDIRNHSIRLVNQEEMTSTLYYADTTSLTVNVTRDGALLLLDDEGLHVSQKEQEKLYSSLQKNWKMLAFQAVWFLALFLCGVSFFVLLIRFLLFFFKKKYSVTQIVSFWVIGTVTVVSILLCSMLMNSFAESYREKIEEQVESAAYMVANQILAKDIEQIEETGGFGGEAYNRLCETMENNFPMNIEFYRQLYCNILKLSEDEKEGYAVAYLDQSIGSYFPLDEVEQEELKRVYETGESVWNQAVEDVSGTYLSVKVPVFDDFGKICGAVAVGVETYVITDTLKALKLKIMMSIIIILMLVWMVSVESISFANNFNIYKKNVLAGEKDILPGHLVRLLVFMVFVAYNMTATFLPVYLLRRTDIFEEEMQAFMGALPITINIFLIGLMSLFCANLVRKYGIRKITVVATMCSLMGNLLIYCIPQFYTICLGLILDGIGVGLITNAIYVMLTYIKDEVNRTWGLTIYNGACLSGINFGMMLGSLLAVSMGQRQVFSVVALSWLLMFVLTGYMVKKIESLLGIAKEEKKEEQPQKMSLGHFVLNKPVLSFIALIQNPYIIFGSFVFYYVPLYCDENGYSEALCSLLIMLYSQVAILGTGVLTDWFSRVFGSYSMYAALGTNIAALGIFAVLPNMGGMLIALFLLGLGAAYAKPVQQNYFLELDKVKRYGEDKSMGVYNFSENIGESLGPVVFGRILSANWFGGAAGMLCLGTAGLGTLHYLMNRKELKDENKKV